MECNRITESSGKESSENVDVFISLVSYRLDSLTFDPLITCVLPSYGVLSKDPGYEVGVLQFQP